MFRQIARQLQNSADIFLFHPLELAAMLEAAWSNRFPAPSPFAIPLPPALLRALGVNVAGVPVWDHLVYAYMMESTGTARIVEGVLREYLHGERLDVPSIEGQRWVRNTEELFYRDSPHYFVFSLTSHVRPDIRATRRNAYYRMFGMDLPHGTDDGVSYPYERPAACNRDFAVTFEQ